MSLFFFFLRLFFVFSFFVFLPPFALFSPLRSQTKNKNRCVTTRTPTQVASHAQKYFIRLASGGARRERRRASIHDITSHAKLRAIVFEFLGGGSLEDQLEDGPLGLEETLNLGTCLARVFHTTSSTKP